MSGSSAKSIRVWTIYRRPADTNDPWQPFLGTRGQKILALLAMQLCERLGGEVQYEYIAMPDDERPAQFPAKFESRWK